MATSILLHAPGTTDTMHDIHRPERKDYKTNAVGNLQKLSPPHIKETGHPSLVFIHGIFRPPTLPLRPPHRHQLAWLPVPCTHRFFSLFFFFFIFRRSSIYLIIKKKPTFSLHHVSQKIRSTSSRISWFLA